MNLSIVIRIATCCEVVGLVSCLSNNVSFLSYVLMLTPPVNGFAELPASFVCELGWHIGIHLFISTLQTHLKLLI